MAWKWSTGLRNYVMGYGSFREAFTDCKLMVYTSPIPTTADAVLTGTYLGTFTKSSDTTAAELIRGWGAIYLITVTVAATGDTFAFTCTGSVDAAITTATYTVPAADNTIVANTAVKICRLFNDIGFKACATGITGLLYVMVQNNQSCTITLVPGGTAAASVSAAQFTQDTNSLLRFGVPASAVISKISGQTWSGVMSASGTAAYGRIVDINDLGTGNTTDKRMQGTIGVGTGDIQISNANITALATETCDTCAFTWPAE